jgi:hypothetical protein
MFCVSCGKPVPEEAAFCQFCGTKQPNLGDAGSHGSSPPQARHCDESSSSLACPNCHRADQVQKVSSVLGVNISDSITKGKGSGGALTVGMAGGQTFVGRSFSGPSETVGEMRTRLAQRLSPPDPPPFDSPIRLWRHVACWVLLILAVLLGIAGLGGSLLWLVPAAISAGACYLLRSRDVKAYNTRVALHNETKAFPWLAAVDRWKTLFYCFRCDGVFIPGERVFMPTTQMNALLYLRKPMQPAAARSDSLDA